MKKQSLPAFVAANFALQKKDFLWLGLVELAFWALTMAGTGIAYRFFGVEQAIAIDIPGVAMLGIAVLMGLFTAISRYWLEFKIGIQMSVPRRRMLVAELALCLAGSALMLGLTALGNALWWVLYASRVPAQQVEALLAQMPVYGWLLAWLLPTALGMMCSGLVARFGNRAGWTLYIIFLALCYLPALLDDNAEKSPYLAAVWQVFRQALPAVGAALTVLAFAVGTHFLLRQSVTK